MNSTLPNAFLGIDLSKKISYYYACDEAGHRILRGKTDRWKVGLQDVVRQLLQTHQVGVCFEAGNISFALARRLRHLGAEVYIVNPYQNALIRQSRKKTDRLDAKMLSEQLRHGNLPPYSVYIPTEKEEGLRKLVSARAGLVRQRTSLSNRIIRICDRYELSFKKSAFSRGNAWKRLGVLTGDWEAIDRIFFEQFYDEFERISSRVHILEVEIHNQVIEHFNSELDLVMTIPGVGPIIGASLIAYSGDLSRFPSAREFARYVGLTPSVRESSGRQESGGICKEGNARLRAYLTQAAVVVTSHHKGTTLYAWYENIRRRKGWKKARVALARKLATICFGVLRHRKPFDPAYVSATQTVTA